MDPIVFKKESQAVVMSEVSPAKTIPLSLKKKASLGRRILNNSMISPKAALQVLLGLLIEGGKHLYDSEKMDFYERIVIEALGTGDENTARTYIGLLEKRFGKNSNRIHFLQGLLHESKGEEGEAEKLYAEILRKDPSNAKAIQRRATMQAAKGNLHDAIRILEYDLVYLDENKEKYTYLEIHPADVKTYLQLSKWHYELNEYEKAIHFLEECILCEADNYIYHTRIGELYFEHKEWGKSIVHFSHSLLLNSTTNNCRAAFGLHLAIKNALASQQDNLIEDANPKETLATLYKKVSEKLMNMYAESPLKGYVKEYLKEA